MTSKHPLIITIVLLMAIVVGTGFYFKDALLKNYYNFGNTFQQFQKTDLGKVVSQVQQEILNPPPLNIGGPFSNAALTKSKIIAQTNIQRFDNGMLNPLIENAQLDAAAAAKAKDMFDKQYFEHVSPSGVDPGTLVKQFRYDYIVSGENLILGNFGSEKEVVQDWMNSPGHRANILNTRYVDIGVAIMKGTYQGHTEWISVQEFGLPITACAAPSTALKDQITSNQLQLNSLSLQIESKQQEINNTNPRSSGYNKLVDEYNALVAQYNPLSQQTKTSIEQYNVQVNTFNQCVNGNK
jgi:uncharacterized protein YkwD